MPLGRYRGVLSVVRCDFVCRKTSWVSSRFARAWSRSDWRTRRRKLTTEWTRSSTSWTKPTSSWNAKKSQLTPTSPFVNWIFRSFAQHFWHLQAVSVAGPTVWNLLPDSLRDPAVETERLFAGHKSHERIRGVTVSCSCALRIGIYLLTSNNCKYRNNNNKSNFFSWRNNVCIFVLIFETECTLKLQLYGTLQISLLLLLILLFCHYIAIHRVIHIWNSLPCHIVNSPTLNIQVTVAKSWSVFLVDRVHSSGCDSMLVVYCSLFYLMLLYVPFVFLPYMRHVLLRQC